MIDLFDDPNEESQNIKNRLAVIEVRLQNIESEIKTIRFMMQIISGITAAILVKIF